MRTKLPLLRIGLVLWTTAAAGAPNRSRSTKSKRPTPRAGGRCPHAGHPIDRFRRHRSGPVRHSGCLLVKPGDHGSAVADCDRWIELDRARPGLRQPRQRAVHARQVRAVDCRFRSGDRAGPAAGKGTLETRNLLLLRRPLRRWAKAVRGLPDRRRQRRGERRLATALHGPQSGPGKGSAPTFCPFATTGECR